MIRCEALAEGTNTAADLALLTSRGSQQVPGDADPHCPRRRGRPASGGNGRGGLVATALASPARSARSPGGTAPLSVGRRLGQRDDHPRGRRFAGPAGPPRGGGGDTRPGLVQCRTAPFGARWRGRPSAIAWNGSTAVGLAATGDHAAPSRRRHRDIGAARTIPAPKPTRLGRTPGWHGLPTVHADYHGQLLRLVIDDADPFRLPEDLVEVDGLPGSRPARTVARPG